MTNARHGNCWKRCMLKICLRVSFLIFIAGFSAARSQQEVIYEGMDFMTPRDSEIVAQKIPDAEVIAGGIRFKETKSGEGLFIERGNTVETIYTGRLLDGTIFNRKTGGWHTFTFKVGAEPRQIIRGWEMSVSRMKEGGKYTVAIPPQFAYGENGRKDQVPPYATVIFDIEILNVKR